jgi:hypothetical protein
VLAAGSLAAASSLDVNVTVTVHALSVQWSANATGGSGTAAKTWALGSLIASQVVTTEDASSRVAVLEIENQSGAAVRLVASCAAASTGTGVAWSRAATAASDAFVMAAATTSNGTTYTALHPADLVLSNGVADAGLWRMNLRFTAPTASTDTNQKTIAVTVTASAPQ